MHAHTKLARVVSLLLCGFWGIKHRSLPMKPEPSCWPAYGISPNIWISFIVFSAKVFQCFPGLRIIQITLVLILLILLCGLVYFML